VLLQEGVELHPRLETKEPPKLRSSEGLRPMCLKRQAFERRRRQIIPLRFEPYGDVLRQLYRYLHCLPFLLSTVSGATCYGPLGPASSTGSCANARHAQVPGRSAPAGTGPWAPACDRPPFRRERVSRAADFRGAASALPMDGMVTNSNSS
jgi:hypothetical protein